MIACDNYWEIVKYGYTLHVYNLDSMQRFYYNPTFENDIKLKKTYSIADIRDAEQRAVGCKDDRTYIW